MSIAPTLFFVPNSFAHIINNHTNMKRIILLSLIYLTTFNFASAQNTNVFTDFIIQKINSESFSSEGEKLVRKYAAKFVDLYNSGTLYEAFSCDQLSQSYTIDYNKMPTNLRYFQWNGNNGEVKRNVWGQYAGTTENYYNSIIASWVIEFIKSNPASNNNAAKEDIEMNKNLFIFIAENYYGNNLELCKQKWRETKDIELRKQLLIKYSKEKANNYLMFAEKNKQRFNYIDADKATNLINALNTGDWNLIESAANRMGWTYNTYLNY